MTAEEDGGDVGDSYLLSLAAEAAASSSFFPPVCELGGALNGFYWRGEIA